MYEYIYNSWFIIYGNVKQYHILCSSYLQEQPVGVVSAFTRGNSEIFKFVFSDGI